MLICIVGKSASGKTTLSKKISKHKGLDLIIPITTRPKRENEEYGLDYYFYSRKEYFNSPIMLDYYCSELDWHYGFLKAELKHYATSKKDNAVIVLNHEQFLTVIEIFNKKNILSIYTSANDNILLERSLKRKDNCEEICRRFLADKKDFAKMFKELTSNNFDFDMILRSDVFDFNNKYHIDEIYNSMMEIIKNEK